MEICYEHEDDEIVHNRKTCPACVQVAALKEEIDKRDKQIAALEDEVKELNTPDGPI